jgi:hypothetical protein
MLYGRARRGVDASPTLVRGVEGSDVFLIDGTPRARTEKILLRDVVIDPRLVELKPDSQLENHDRIASRQRARDIHRIRRGKTVLIPVRELVYGSLIVAGVEAVLYTLGIVIWLS